MRGISDDDFGPGRERVHRKNDVLGPEHPPYHEEIHDDAGDDKEEQTDHGEHEQSPRNRRPSHKRRDAGRLTLDLPSLSGEELNGAYDDLLAGKGRGLI